MVEYEDSQLTSFCRYPQITTAYRAAISENNLKSSRRFSTVKDNEGDTILWLEATEMQFSQDPCSQCSDWELTTGREVTIAEILPKDWGIPVTHQSPQAGGGPAPGRVTSQTLALKVIKGYAWDGQRAAENWNLPFVIRLYIWIFSATSTNFLVILTPINKTYLSELSY